MSCQIIYLRELHRVVHAKAAGAWGEFEVTNDVSSLTSAKFLNGVGKKTPVLFRLSTTGGEKGSADTVRDVRGFSVKFFTEEGNHDIVGNHIVSLTISFALYHNRYTNTTKPVFFVRDPIRFPSLNRSHKRHPSTNRPDWTMVGLFLGRSHSVAVNNRFISSGTST